MAAELPWRWKESRDAYVCLNCNGEVRFSGGRGECGCGKPPLQGPVYRGNEKIPFKLMRLRKRLGKC